MRCSYRPRTGKPILPRFSTGEGGADVDEAAELRRQAEEGLTARLAAHGPAPGLTEEEYRERLDFELSVIERMKFPATSSSSPTSSNGQRRTTFPSVRAAGPARARSSPTRSTITDLDPLRFGLLFERFLNPERVSMPDFDIDFCQERRDEVIRYVQARYGQDRVAQIITFGSLLARGVLRDVGRVLEDALRPGRQADQARAAESGQPGHASPGHGGRAAPAEPPRRRSRSSRACWRSRRSSKAFIATPRRMPPASSSATGRSRSSCRSTAIRSPTCLSPSST